MRPRRAIPLAVLVTASVATVAVAGPLHSAIPKPIHPDPQADRHPGLFDEQPDDLNGHRALMFAALDSDGDGNDDELASFGDCPMGGPATLGVWLHRRRDHDVMIEAPRCVDLPTDGGYGLLTTGDIDGDGADEILVPAPATSSLWVVEPGRDTHLRRHRIVLAGGHGAAVVRVTDLDDDGEPELVSSSFGGLVTHDVRGRHPELVERTAGVPGLMDVDDLGDDDMADLVTLTAAGEVVVITRTDGTWLSHTAAEGAVAFATGDVDGDGDGDLVTADRRGVTVQSGDDRVRERQAEIIGVLVHDLDGDGDGEVVVSTPDHTRVLQFEDATGLTDLAAPLRTRGSLVVAADPNQDGRPDLVAASRRRNETYAVWHNRRVNNRPVAEDVSTEVSDERPTSIHLRGWDPDHPHDVPQFKLLTAPERGAAGIDGDGVLEYTPPGRGFLGDDTLTVAAFDEHGLESDPVTITLDVVDNRAPVVHLAETTEPEQTLRATPVEVDIFGEDPDGDPLLLDVVDPAHGSVDVLGADRLRYTPDPDFSGVERIEIRVVDDDGARSQPGWLRVNVSRNAAPVIEIPTVVTVIPGVPTRVHLQISDPFGGPFDWEVTSSSGFARREGDDIVVLVKRAADFDPSFGNGFLVTVRDPGGLVVERPVEIRLDQTAGGPSGRVRVSTAVDTPVRVRLADRGREQDPDVEMVTDPAEHGSIQLRNGVATYTPDPGWTGREAVFFLVVDPVAGDRRGILVITVHP